MKAPCPRPGGVNDSDFATWNATVSSMVVGAVRALGRMVATSARRSTPSSSSSSSSSLSSSSSSSLSSSSSSSSRSCSVSATFQSWSFIIIGLSVSVTAAGSSRFWYDVCVCAALRSFYPRPPTQVRSHRAGQSSALRDCGRAARSHELQRQHHVARLRIPQQDFVRLFGQTHATRHHVHKQHHSCTCTTSVIVSRVFELSLLP